MLIYTSTYNTVFNGQYPIMNGDESFPHAEISSHSDCYAPSKTLAEQVIMQAHLSSFHANSNRTSTTSNTTTTNNLLNTYIIRPAAIYGEEEERHFPRIIQHMDTGIFQFLIGEGAIVDWVHVDNLVHSYICVINKHMKEYIHLRYMHNNTSNNSSSNNGSAEYNNIYFISDGTPINNFEFLRPLCEGIVMVMYIYIYKCI